MAAQHPPISNRKPTDAIYAQVVERYAKLFENPAARLRFLHSTLAKQSARQEELRQSLERFRFLEKTPLYNWIMEARLYSSILEELRIVMHNAPPAQRARMQQVELPFKAKFLYFCYQIRYALYGVGVVVMALLLFGLYSGVMRAGQYVARRVNRPPTTIVVTNGGQPSATPPVTKALNLYDAKPVWLIEKDDKFENYSNGGRISTEYEIDNHPRAYYLIPRNADGPGEKVGHAPIGILYHTTEGEQINFSQDNNSSIQERSRNLIKHVIQANKSYNYLIDRFGKIFRVVRDEQTANHAGYSLWADQKYVYIGLNESFIGVAFESSQSNSLEETLTEAQVLSGRQLTAILRSKYKIEDVNCTTHGLVSVNPDNGAIAAHYDWAKNFPFEAMGLSDKYKVPTPHMSDYGFTWDQEVLEKLEKTLWPGALAADEEFKRHAEKLRINPDVLRAQLRERYRDHYARQKALQHLAGAQSAKLTLQSDASETPH